MKEKRELQIFEHDERGPGPDGVVPVRLVNTTKRFINSRHVEGALEEAKQFLSSSPFRSRIRSINVDTEGHIRVMLNNKSATNSPRISGWRIRRP